MRIAICANEEQKKELLEKGINNSVEVAWFNEQQQSINNFDAYFDLLFDEADNTNNIFLNDVIVFVNAVATITSDLPSNYIRINAWNGFLSRTIIEVAASNAVSKEKASGVLHELGWNFIWASDEPGLIAARIIAMIINEAYFALEENVSTKEEIDIAMKLGTNYPNGPFEWSKKIGLQNIYALLKKLNEKESRYEISPLLISECGNVKMQTL
jgi:3-hydroxybutyryl-CoA dehydrogenase